VSCELAENIIVRTTEDTWAYGDQVALRFPEDRLFVFPAEPVEG
jgi:hypothetical protein